MYKKLGGVHRVNITVKQAFNDVIPREGFYNRFQRMNLKCQYALSLMVRSMMV